MSRLLSENKGSLRNSRREILKPREIKIMVDKVTVLFLSAIMQAIVPCCIPEFCSNLYWVMFFSFNKFDILRATALFTVIFSIPPFRIFPIYIVCDIKNKIMQVYLPILLDKNFQYIYY